jgi:hypothetical protein
LQAAAAWKRFPLEIFAHAPKRIVLDDTWQNTSRIKWRLPGWTNWEELERAAIVTRPPSIASPERIEKETAEARSKGTMAVPPQGTIKRPFEVLIQRADRDPQRMRWLELEENRRVARFSQHLEFRPLNPLIAQVTAPGANFLPVVIRNPSGEPLSANVKYYYEGGDYSDNHATGSIDLKPGVSEGVIRLTPDRPDRHLWAGGYLDLQDVAKFLLRGCKRYDLPELGRLQAIRDGDMGVVQQAELDSGEPQEGQCPSETPSVRLKYQFTDGWGFVRVVAPDNWVRSDEQGYSPFSDFRSLGIWVYGDGKGLVPRVRLRSHYGTTFQLTGEPISWRGWRFVEFPAGLGLEDNPHWGGKPGYGHIPYWWDTVFLLDNVSKKAVEGEIYISAPAAFH